MKNIKKHKTQKPTTSKTTFILYEKYSNIIRVVCIIHNVYNRKLNPIHFPLLLKQPKPGLDLPLENMFCVGFFFATKMLYITESFKKHTEKSKRPI